MNSASATSHCSSLATFETINPFALLHELTTATAVLAATHAEAVPADPTCCFFVAEDIEGGVFFTPELQQAMDLKIAAFEEENEVEEEEAYKYTETVGDLAALEEPQSPALQTILPQYGEDKKPLPYCCCHECLYGAHMEASYTESHNDEGSGYLDGHFENYLCDGNIINDYYDYSYYYYNYYSGYEDISSYDMTCSPSYPAVDLFCGYDYHTYHTSGLYVPLVCSY